MAFKTPAGLSPIEILMVSKSVQRKTFIFCDTYSFQCDGNVYIPDSKLHYCNINSFIKTLYFGDTLKLIFSGELDLYLEKPTKYGKPPTKFYKYCVPDYKNRTVKEYVIQ